MNAAMPTQASTPAQLQAPATTGGGGAAPAGAQPDIGAVLQQLVTLLSQLSGVLGAGNGAAQLAASAPGTAAAPTMAAASAAPAAPALASGVTIGGGAPLAGAATMQSANHVATLATATLGTVSAATAGLTLSSDIPATTGTVITGGGGAMAAPAAAAAAPATGGPTFDTRRLLGTPQPGGVIDVALRNMATTAPPARSDGNFIVLTDGNGAQLQAHVHGAWQHHPDRIAEGIQRGYLAVHLHDDGTLHLHDVV